MIDAGTAGFSTVVVTRAEIQALGYEEATRLERALLDAVAWPAPNGLEVLAEYWSDRRWPDRYYVRQRGRGVPCITTLPPEPRARRDDVAAHT